jgi:hypothetical protein
MALDYSAPAEETRPIFAAMELAPKSHLTFTGGDRTRALVVGRGMPMTNGLVPLTTAKRILQECAGRCGQPVRCDVIFNGDAGQWEPMPA